MSNNTRNSSDQYDADTWNRSQLLGVIGVVGTCVVGVLMIPNKENNSMQPDAPLQAPIVEAILENRQSFLGLQIIRIGNPEEMHTLKSSGKDGWYVFQEGNTITYWKTQSGIVESNTYTLNR